MAAGVDMVTSGPKRVGVARADRAILALGVTAELPRRPGRALHDRYKTSWAERLTYAKIEVAVFV